MKWSLSQNNVINLVRGNLLVSASAGSGKTAVLTERIVNLILNYNVSIDELLIITFTNAAASEMTERILKAIELKMNDENKDYLEQQIFLSSCSNIQTFHSFCYDILKNNYYRLDLDQNLKILKDSQRKIIINEVIEDVFMNYYNENNQEFISIVNKYGGKYFDDGLREIIIQIYNFILNKPNIDKFKEHILGIYTLDIGNEIFNTEWGSYLRKEYIFESLNIKESIINFKSRVVLDIIEDEIILNDLEVLEKFIYTLKDGYEQCRKFLNAFKFLRFPKNTSKDFEKYKIIRGKFKKFLDDLKKKVFFKTQEEVIENIRNLHPTINILLDVVFKFKDRFDLVKRSQNLIDFNDMEHLALKLLEDEFVCKKLKKKFKYIFIDEYQDTNYIQECLVSKIKREDSPNVFMVGDIKQSIYSFRGTKIDLFYEKYKLYNTVTSLDKVDKFENKILLYDNYRSKKQIIDFINFIFKNIMVSEVSNLVYTSDEYLSYMGNSEFEDMYPGEIRIGIIDKNSKCADESEENLELDESECNLIVNYIKKMVNCNSGNIHKIFDKELNQYRQIDYRDIVILMRNVRASDKSLVLEKILTKNNIPVYFDGGDTFFDSIEVIVVISLLKIIDNPLDDIDILTVLRSDIFDFSDNDLAYLRITGKDEYLYNNIKRVCAITNLDDNNKDVYLNEDFYLNIDEFNKFSSKCKDFLEKLDLYRKKSIFMKIDDFIWFLYSSTNYYFCVSTMDDGAKRQNNLMFIFDKAKEFRLSNFSGLFNFIEYLKNSKKSGDDILVPKNISKNDNVVRIMSIHKSKGLEFPVVILCNTSGAFNMRNINSSIVLDDDFGIGINHIDYDKNLETQSLIKVAIKKKIRKHIISEELRILYVALTRAKDKLFIIGICKDRKFFERISDITKCRSYLDFIGNCLMRHVDGEYFRNNCDNYDINNIVTTDECSLYIDIFNYNDLVDKQDGKHNGKHINDLEKILNTGRYIDYIDKIINFNYKFKDSIDVPNNISVSKILIYNNTGDDKIIFKKPDLLSENKNKIYSRLDIGNLYHSFMQNIELNFNIDIDYIDKEIHRMLKLNILEVEDLNHLSKYKILEFFNSSIGTKVLRAVSRREKIYREFEFLIKHKVSKICDHESIRIQGIIDLFFFENNKIILVDYKTDKMSFTDSDNVLKKYKEQLYYYKVALEKIFNIKVSEKYVYSFDLSEGIRV